MPARRSVLGRGAGAADRGQRPRASARVSGEGALRGGALLGEVLFEDQVDGFQKDVAGTRLEAAHPERQVTRRHLKREGERLRASGDFRGAQQSTHMHVRQPSPRKGEATTLGCACHYIDVNWAQYEAIR